MKFNHKPVLTPDNFSFSKVQIGDYVNQDVVDDAMDCVPPACLCSRCAQMGEAYSHRVDPNTGNLRPTFATFTKVGGEWPHGIWEYRGHCFVGEIEERGEDPVYA